MLLKKSKDISYEEKRVEREINSEVVAKAMFLPVQTYFVLSAFIS